IGALAFSPDGSRLVWGKGNRRAPTTLIGTQRPPVKAWDFPAGQAVPFSGQAPDVLGLSCTPDGRRVAATSRDGTVCVWDSTSTRVLLRREGGRVRLCVAFPRDGTRLAVGSAGAGGGRLTVWDAQTGNLLPPIEAPAEPVFGVAFSPDGTRLAAV